MICVCSHGKKAIEESYKMCYLFCWKAVNLSSAAAIENPQMTFWQTPILSPPLVFGGFHSARTYVADGDRKGIPEAFFT